MQLKNIVCALFAAILTGGCSPDYSIIGGGEKEIVEVEVEVPVYIETEVPEDPGVIWVDSFIQPQSIDGVDILWVIDTSGSMNRYDESLIAGIEAMLSALPTSGWRLAMISNDPDRAALEAQRIPVVLTPLHYREAGLAANKCRHEGYSAGDCQQAGYSCSECRSAGFA